MIVLFFLQLFAIYLKCVICYSQRCCRVQDPSVIDTEWTLTLSLQLRFTFSRDQIKEEKEEHEVVREQLDNLDDLSVSKSTGRENEEVLVETEVGAKEEKEAD